MENMHDNQNEKNQEAESVRESPVPYGQHGEHLFKRDAVTSQQVQRFVTEKLPLYDELFRKLAE